MAQSYLVRPKISTFGRLWNIYESFGGSDGSDLSNQIYVPDQFVFGNLTQGRNGFVLNGVFYRDSEEALREYQGNIDAGRLEVVSELSLKDETLQVLRENGSAIYQARSRLNDVVGSTGFTLAMFPAMPEALVMPEAFREE